MYIKQIFSISLFLSALSCTHAMYQYASQSDTRCVNQYEIPQMDHNAACSTKVIIENLQKENAALQAIVHRLTEKNNDLEKRIRIVESLMAPTKLLIEREALVQEMARRWMLQQETHQHNLSFEEAQIEREKEL